MMVRVSPGSPSQWKATRSPRPAATWRSTQLTATLSLPPTNHLAKGRSHSRTSVHGVSQRQPLRPGLPEGERVGLGLVVDAGLGVGLLGELLGRGEGPRLVEQGRQPFLSGLAHCSLLSGPSGSDAAPDHYLRRWLAGQRLAHREDLAATAMPLMTPAAEVYQAHAAVTTPAMPPALTMLVLLEKFPMARRMNGDLEGQEDARTPPC